MSCHILVSIYKQFEIFAVRSHRSHRLQLRLKENTRKMNSCCPGQANLSKSHEWIYRVEGMFSTVAKKTWPLSHLTDYVCDMMKKNEQCKHQFHAFSLEKRLLGEFSFFMSFFALPLSKRKPNNQNDSHAVSGFRYMMIWFQISFSISFFAHATHPHFVTCNYENVNIMPHTHRVW